MLIHFHAVHWVFMMFMMIMMIMMNDDRNFVKIINLMGNFKKLSSLMLVIKSLVSYCIDTGSVLSARYNLTTGAIVPDAGDKYAYFFARAHVVGARGGSAGGSTGDELIGQRAHR